MANYFLVFHVHCIPENPNFHSSLWRPYSQELGQAKAVVSRAGQAWGCWSCAVCPLESLEQVMAAALVSLGLDCLKCTCYHKKLPRSLRPAMLDVSTRWQCVHPARLNGCRPEAWAVAGVPMQLGQAPWEVTVGTHSPHLVWYKPRRFSKKLLEFMFVGCFVFLEMSVF